MTDEQLTRLFLILRRPIYWDPVPPWLKLGKEQIDRFQQVQAQLNAKIAEIDQQKVAELTKIAGGKIV